LEGAKEEGLRRRRNKKPRQHVGELQSKRRSLFYKTNGNRRGYNRRKTFQSWSKGSDLEWRGKRGESNLTEGRDTLHRLQTPWGEEKDEKTNLRFSERRHESALGRERKRPQRNERLVAHLYLGRGRMKTDQTVKVRCCLKKEGLVPQRD